MTKTRLMDKLSQPMYYCFQLPMYLTFVSEARSSEDQRDEDPLSALQLGN